MRREIRIAETRTAHQIYRMPPRPCPYIDGRIEQNVFTELSGPQASQHYGTLSQSGFRRSHGIAYRPACPGCTSCVPVRVVAGDFRFSRSMRRVWKANADVTGQERPARATPEQYDLFARYMGSRHGDGEMASMIFVDFRAMVEDTPIETVMIEFRDAHGFLIGGCLADRLGDGLSAVYSFFDPALEKRGLGTYIVLWLIERARAMGLPHVYLGYWIAESPKMAYKTRFQPIEALGPEGWRRLQI